MPFITRGGLNVAGQSISLGCAVPVQRVGVGITGNWAGTLTLQVSYDGVNFFPSTFTPFPSGTGVQTVTANGNYFADVGGAVAFRVVATTLTSGTAIVAVSAANDGSWRDAFLAPSSLFPSQNVAAGAVNSQVIAAVAGQAWRCRSVEIGFSVAPAAAVEFQILDGASTVLFDIFIPKDTPVGFYNVPLPPPDADVPGSGGVVGTVGNSMTLKLFAPGGSVVSTVNAELHAA